MTIATSQPGSATTTKQRWPFVWLVDVLYDHELSPRAVVAHGALDSNKPGKDVAYQHLAKITGMHPTTAKRAIQELIDKGRATKGDEHRHRSENGTSPTYEYHIKEKYSARQEYRGKKKYLNLPPDFLKKYAKESPTATRLLLVLCNECAKYRGCALDIRRLSRAVFGSDTKPNRKKIRRALQSLFKCGAIQTLEGTEILIVTEYDPPTRRTTDPAEIDIGQVRRTFDRLHPEGGSNGAIGGGHFEVGESNGATGGSHFELGESNGAAQGSHIEVGGAVSSYKGSQTEVLQGGKRSHFERALVTEGQQYQQAISVVTPYKNTTTTNDTSIASYKEPPATGIASSSSSKEEKNTEPSVDTPNSQEPGESVSQPLITAAGYGKVGTGDSGESNAPKPILAVEAFKIRTKERYPGFFNDQTFASNLPPIAALYVIPYEGKLTEEQKAILAEMLIWKLERYFEESTILQGDHPDPRGGARVLKNFLENVPVDWEIEAALKKAAPKVYDPTKGHFEVTTDYNGNPLDKDDPAYQRVWISTERED